MVHHIHNNPRCDPPPQPQPITQSTPQQPIARSKPILIATRQLERGERDDRESENFEMRERVRGLRLSKRVKEYKKTSSM